MSNQRKIIGKFSENYQLIATQLHFKHQKNFLKQQINYNVKLAVKTFKRIAIKACMIDFSEKITFFSVSFNKTGTN